ncbi:MAG: hypothetical protein ACU84J_11495, partial [Gammaproteobacteria bacterium]
QVSFGGHRHFRSIGRVTRGQAIAAPTPAGMTPALSVKSNGRCSTSLQATGYTSFFVVNAGHTAQ